MKLPVSFPTLVPRDNNLGTLRQLFTDLTSILQRIAGANNNPDEGVTGGRPTQQLTIGQFFFDTTLGKPVWWSGSSWGTWPATLVLVTAPAHNNSSGVAGQCAFDVSGNFYVCYAASSWAKFTGVVSF